ncbi:hypothetical protein CNMCM7691_000766 [Aspergillus felis]|uniref:C2H2-type domain-containing protein n=1 Tax=Aspergillus felis TaxID=1287682 RepID=A0A8H6R0E3_9EURO|nr:hypothetical protein CNMCM7691_000766 [Aspergillus felis]
MAVQRYSSQLLLFHPENHTGIWGQSFQALTPNGRLDVVNYLVDHGADLNPSVQERLRDLIPQQPAHHDADDSPNYQFETDLTISLLSNLGLPTCHLQNSFSNRYDNIHASLEERLLYLSAEHGYLGIVKYLVSHGADVNARRYLSAPQLPQKVRMAQWDDIAERVNSPVCLAALNGHVDVVEYLIRHGAELNAETKNILLFLAAGNGHLRIVQLLVRQGADVDVAAYYHERDNTLVFDEHYPLSVYYFVPPPKTSPLYDAAQKGCLKVVKYLLKYAKDIDRLYDSLLCVAWENDHYNIIDYLIGHTRHRSGIAAIIARERYKIGRCLLAKLSQLRQQLIDESCSGSASIPLMSFTAQLGTHESLWSKGTGVIRDLMDGHLPSKLLDVVSCVLVANAMRSAVSDSARCYSEQEFINDLPRWCNLVISEERPLFEEIVSCLWGRSWEIGGAGSNQSSPETLQHFQELVSNLVNQCGQFTSIQMGTLLAGYRLRYFQQHSPIVAQSSRLCKQAAPTVGQPPPGMPEIWKEKCDEDASQAQNPEQLFHVLSRISVLMAGAIFGVVLLGLCLIRFGYAALRFEVHNGQHLGPVEILLRNSSILIVYLGLSNIRLASGGWKSTDDLAHSVPSEGESRHPPSLLSSLPEPVLQMPPLNGSDSEGIQNSAHSQGLEYFRSSISHVSYHSCSEEDTASPPTEKRLGPASELEGPSARLASSPPIAIPTSITSGTSTDESRSSKILQCPLCSKKLTKYPGNLRRHQRRMHSAEAERFFCKNYEACEYEDKSKSNVKAHERKCNGRSRRRWKCNA